jgi:ABC-2 type transport system ATP-binding protein
MTVMDDANMQNVIAASQDAQANSSALSPALVIRGLTKSFGGVQAVNNLDLQIPRGEFHALLGPNGAGKTTTLRMVAGLAKPDAGSIQVFGLDVMADPQAAKREMAFLPDDPMLYGKLTALEYLEFVAGLWSIEGSVAAARATDLLKWLELWDKAYERTEGYSRGMRQKLALAGALIHQPKLMILDEPLTGLDAHAARFVKDLLVDFVKQGNTIVLTTHILEIAERLSERISIIQKGKIVAEGTLEELRAQSGRAGQSGATLEDVFLNLTDEKSSAANKAPASQ